MTVQFRLVGWASVAMTKVLCGDRTHAERAADHSGQPQQVLRVDSDGSGRWGTTTTGRILTVVHLVTANYTEAGFWSCLLYTSTYIPVFF